MAPAGHVGHPCPCAARRAARHHPAVPHILRDLCRGAQGPSQRDQGGTSIGFVAGVACTGRDHCCARPPAWGNLTLASATGYIAATWDGLVDATTWNSPDRVGGYGWGSIRRRQTVEGGQRRAGSAQPRRRGRNIAAAGVAVALLTPLTLALSSSGPAAASSDVNPNGVLKYGFDLNNEFSNDFAPATEENDCSYTVTSNIYQSMTTPGNTGIGGGVAQSWTISNNSSTDHLPHPARSRVLERPARDLSRRGGQLEPHEDEPAALVALRHFEHRDAQSLDRGRQPQQAHRG